MPGIFLLKKSSVSVNWSLSLYQRSRTDSAAAHNAADDDKKVKMKAKVMSASHMPKFYPSSRL